MLVVRNAIFAAVMATIEQLALTMFSEIFIVMGIKAMLLYILTKESIFFAIAFSFLVAASLIIYNNVKNVVKDYLTNKK